MKIKIKFIIWVNNWNMGHFSVPKKVDGTTGQLVLKKWDIPVLYGMSGNPTLVDFFPEECL